MFLYDGSQIPLVKELFATTGDIFNITDDINFSSLDYIGADNLNYSSTKFSYQNIKKYWVRL